jgi:hypothetical protein
LFFQPFLIFVNMKKCFSIKIVLISILFFQSLSYAAPLFDSNIEAAISSAESFFKMMKNRNYPKMWLLLTQKSKDVIVDDVYKAEAGAGMVYLRENINNDFTGSGRLSEAYWKNFLENFNPDMVLEQSKWDIGKFEKDKGEIIIKNRKAESPAILMMLKENGVWKVGFVETFWARKK